MSPGKVTTIDFEKFYNIVDGKQRGSDKIHHGVNPTTGQELWDCPIASEQDLNDAVAAAKKAFPAWRDTPIEKRKELLGKLAESFQQHSDEFTTLLCKESGKPRKFAAIEVGGVPAFIGHHLTLDVPSDRVEDEEKEIFTEYSPLGVCGGKQSASELDMKFILTRPQPSAHGISP
jgi:acyl-CoA reductase-like NAD-dependent aldehyde dehydrogenase